MVAIEARPSRNLVKKVKHESAKLALAAIHQAFSGVARIEAEELAKLHVNPGWIPEFLAA
jgi:hypothetical protein